MNKEEKQFLANKFTEKWIKNNPKKMKLARKVVRDLLLHGKTKIKKKLIK